MSVSAVEDRRHKLLEASLFHDRRTFFGALPFVFGATHFDWNAKRAVVAPMSLITGQPFSIPAVIADKNFRLGLLLNPSQVPPVLLVFVNVEIASDSQISKWNF